MRIVVDSYAWIELFMGSEKGRTVKEMLENAEEVYTPDIVLAEVARKYAREGIDYETIDRRLGAIVESSDIVCLDAEIAAMAAKCYLELEANAKKAKLNLPSLFDAIVLAMGRLLESKVVTGDRHFKELPETVWIG